MVIYIFEIDTNTLEIESHTNDYEDDEGICWCKDECNCYERAAFNEDGFEQIYCESKISLDRAKTLVYNKAIELRNKFQNCIRSLQDQKDTKMNVKEIVEKLLESNAKSQSVVNIEFDGGRFEVSEVIYDEETDEFVLKAVLEQSDESDVERKDA